MADTAVHAEAPRAPASGVSRDARGLLRLAGRTADPASLAPVARLVRLAVDDDDPAGLLRAAAAELGRPLGLAEPAGEPIAHAPDDAGGRRALSVARAAARRPATSPPPGWRVVPVGPPRTRAAVLAVDAGGDGSTDPLLDLVVALVGEQLLRAGLRHSQRAAVLRRLVSEPAVDAARAREQAAAFGLTLLDAYWPAVVMWVAGAPGPAAVERIDREARRMAPGALIVPLNGCVVLLHPGAAAAAGDVIGWVERVIAHSRGVAPARDARAVVADEPAAVGSLAAGRGAARASRRIRPPRGGRAPGRPRP
jgi:hypothetical protein